MVGIDIDSAVSPPAGFQLEVTVFHWVKKETAMGFTYHSHTYHGYTQYGYT